MIIYLILSFGIGILFSAFYMKSRTTALNILIDEGKLQLEESKRRLVELQNEILQINQEHKNDIQFVREGATKENERIRVAHEEKVERLREVYEQKILDQSIYLKEEYKKELNHQIEVLRTQMANITEQTLKQRSEELSKGNKENMSSIIEPLKQHLEQMRKAMDTNRDVYTENTASLRKQIELMAKTTESLGQEADKLSSALQSAPKVQGNFGEMRLELLLDKFGFKEGVEYEREVYITDNSGNKLKNETTNKMMRPDVILHYPDNKDVIIDAKMSLTAYVEYVNAEDEETRSKALKNHLKSVKDHVEELKKKDYSKYLSESRTTMDFVIMFVPNEAALATALMNDVDLWKDAFDSKVFITGEQNLFAVLKLLQIAWTQKAQTDNQKKIIELAERFVDRLGDFTERFTKVGQMIDNAANAYNSAENKLISGNQSLLKPAKELVTIGVQESANHPLPEVKTKLVIES